MGWSSDWSRSRIWSVPGSIPGPTETFFGICWRYFGNVGHVLGTYLGKLGNALGTFWVCVSPAFSFEFVGRVWECFFGTSWAIRDRLWMIWDFLKCRELKIQELLNQQAVLTNSKNAYISDLGAEIVRSKSGIDLSSLISED